MSFSRINYDQCAYDLQLDRSVGPGNYRLFPGYADNCKKCYPYNQPTNSKEPTDKVFSKSSIAFLDLTVLPLILFLTSRKHRLESTYFRILTLYLFPLLL